MFIFKKR